VLWKRAELTPREDAGKLVFPFPRPEVTHNQTHDVMVASLSSDEPSFTIPRWTVGEAPASEGWLASLSGDEGSAAVIGKSKRAGLTGAKIGITSTASWKCMPFN
jgi:hypothetical protein